MEDNDTLWKIILKTEFNINQIDNLSKHYGFLALVVHDKRGFSILHWAVILGMIGHHLSICFTIYSWLQIVVLLYIGLNELVLYLLNKGVPVDLKVKIKEEPLPIHLAALEGRLKTIDILIKYGTDINAVDR